MRGKLIIIIGVHQLICDFINEYVKYHKNFIFLPRIKNETCVRKGNTENEGFDYVYLNEVRKNDVIFNNLNANRCVIVEQWYLGIWSKARARGIDRSDEIIMAQIEKFSNFEKMGIYVATDTEKLIQEFLIEQRRRELIEMEHIIKMLQLRVENLDGELLPENIQRRLFYILDGANSA